MISLYINWHLDPEIVRFAALSLRWYSLLFAFGFYAGYWVGVQMFKKEGRYEPRTEMLLVALVIGTFVGARMGHVLFYDPGFYFSHPIEILKIWKGGLSSHGTVLGMLAGLFIYVYGGKAVPQLFTNTFWKGKRQLIPVNPGRYTYLGQMDLVVLFVLVGAIFIRVGNFTNSEIVGTPTDLPWGVVFTQPVEEGIKKRMPQVESVALKKESWNGFQDVLLFTFKDKNYNPQYLQQQLNQRGEQVFQKANQPIPHLAVPGEKGLSFEVDFGQDPFVARAHVLPIPRHPAQLYEALWYLLLFLFIYRLWQKGREENNAGKLSGLFLILGFGGRFLIEFVKEDQVAAEAGLLLNYGQVLSVPLVILGCYLYLGSRKGKWPKTLSL